MHKLCPKVELSQFMKHSKNIEQGTDMPLFMHFHAPAITVVPHVMTLVGLGDEGPVPVGHPLERDLLDGLGHLGGY